MRKPYYVLKNTKTGEYVGEVHSSDEGTHCLLIEESSKTAKRFSTGAAAYEFWQRYCFSDEDIRAVEIKV